MQLSFAPRKCVVKKIIETIVQISSLHFWCIREVRNIPDIRLIKYWHFLQLLIMIQNKYEHQKEKHGNIKLKEAVFTYV